MNKLIMLIFFSFLFLCGCVSGEANRYYLKQKFPARSHKDVEIFREKPSREYVVMADFQVSRGTFKHLQKRAAGIGADAVIVTCTGGWYSTSEVWADKDRYSDTCTGLIGTAIKYKK